MSSLAFLALSAGVAGAQSEIESANQAYLVRNYKEAINLYEQGLGKNPNQLDAQVNLAYAYYISNNPTKATQWFEAASKNPEAASKYPMLAFHYAESLRMIGSYDKAKTVYQTLPAELAYVVNQGLAFCDFGSQNLTQKPIFIVRNEASINSPQADYAPTFYKNKVIFNSARPVYMPLLSGNSDDTYNWLYTTNRNLGSGLLSSPINLFQNNNFEQHANGAPAGFNDDGKMVAYMLNSLTSGIRHLPAFNIRSGEIAIANVLADDNWAVNESRAFNHFKNMEGVTVGFPVLSADGNTLYFSSNINSGVGGFDIYVSFYQNNQWTAPQNLGHNVNSLGDEIVSSIGDDGTLYFASNFLQGFGGYDIYSATLETEGKAQVWRNVRNLGASVNSIADDMYFIYDSANKYGYFASNREGGKGDFDIYSAQLIGDLASAPLAVSNEKNDIVVNYPAQPNPSPTPKPNPTPKENTDIVGKKPTPAPTPAPAPKPATTDPEEVPCAINFYVGAITDAVTRQPLKDAIVYIKNTKTDAKEKAITNKFGEYSVLLDPMTEYIIVASKTGYQNETFQVNTYTGGQRTLLGSHALQRAGTSNDVDVFGDPVYPETPPNTFTNNNNNSPKTYTASTNFSPATPDKTMPDEGYLVQVGAFSKLDDAMLLKLSQHGNVITEKGKNGATIYRLGIYADKFHADKATEDVKKLGFTDAWKIKTPIDNKTMAGKLAANAQVIFPYDANAARPVANNTDLPFDKPNYAELSPLSKAIIKETAHDSWADNNKVAPRSLKTTAANNTIPNNKIQDTPIAPPANFSKGVEFRIQLGAFKEPEKVSFTNLNDLAPISTLRQSNGLTYFYLGSFPSLEAANSTKAKAEARGAQQPFIVAFRNGQRIPLSDIK
jgi:cell division septation protein DedD